MKNLRVRVKILIILGLLLLGYTLLIGMMNWNISEAKSFAERASNDLFPAALSSQEAETTFQREIKHYQDAVVLQDQASLNAASQEGDLTLAALNEVEQHTSADARRQAEVVALVSRIEEMQTTARQTYPALIKNPESSPPDTMVTVSRLASQSHDLANALHLLHTSLSADLRVELQGMDAEAAHERLLSLIVFVFAALWIAGSFWLIERQIIHPIQSLSLRLRDIAEGDGDLTKRLRVQSTDELGQVSSSFNSFVDRLQNILQEVAASTIQLSSATSHISGSSRQMAQRADRQEQETAQIAMAMEEMANSVGEVSRSSQTATDKALHASASARDSGKTVQDTLATMRSVAASVEATATQLTELGQQSKQIGKIVAVIHDIANQTNLLALNAAIEAARAGEHGRGFAVVAGEVRGLAERTGQATQQIGEVMNLLESGTDSAVTTMRRSQAQVQLGVLAATTTGESLRNIIDAAELASEMIARVASATREQSTSTAQVNQNIGRIAIVTRESAAGAQQSADAATDLSALATNLQTLISKFQLEATA